MPEPAAPTPSTPASRVANAVKALEGTPSPATGANDKGSDATIKPAEGATDKTEKPAGGATSTTDEAAKVAADKAKTDAEVGPTDSDKKDPKVSEGWARLSRQEKKNRLEAEARETAHKKAVAEFEGTKKQAAEVLTFVAEFRKDPYAYLNKLGLTVEEWNKRAEADKAAGKLPELQPIKAELETLKGETKKLTEAQRAEHDSRQAAADKQNVDGYRAAIEAAAAGPEFVLFRKYEATQEAIDLAELTIKQEFEKSEQYVLPPPEEMVAKVNEFLIKRAKSIYGDEAIEKLLHPKPAQDPKAEAIKASDKKEPSTQTDAKKPGRLTRDQRLEHAVKALEG